MAPFVFKIALVIINLTDAKSKTPTIGKIQAHLQFIELLDLIFWQVTMEIQQPLIYQVWKLTLILGN